MGQSNGSLGVQFRGSRGRGWAGGAREQQCGSRAFVWTDGPGQWGRSICSLCMEASTSQQSARPGGMGQPPLVPNSSIAPKEPLPHERPPPLSQLQPPRSLQCSPALWVFLSLAAHVNKLCSAWPLCLACFQWRHALKARLAVPCCVPHSMSRLNDAWLYGWTSRLWTHMRVALPFGLSW